MYVCTYQERNLVYFKYYTSVPWFYIQVVPVPSLDKGEGNANLWYVSVIK